MMAFMSQHKQWSMESILSLIDAFKMHRNLWDPHHPNFKNRHRKSESFKEIAQIFDTTGEEVQRKMKNILSQYHRERRNYKKMMKAGQLFKTKWFGYHALSFLHNENEATEEVVIKKEYDSESSDTAFEREANSTFNIQSESEFADESFQLEEEENFVPPTENFVFFGEKTLHPPTPPHASIRVQAEPACNSTKSQPQSKIKFKKINNSNTEEASETPQGFKMMRSVYERVGEEKRRDEYDIFGEMVASHIRNLTSEYSKVTVQHQISELLYQARISQLTAKSSTAAPSPSLPQVFITAMPSSSLSQPSTTSQN